MATRNKRKSPLGTLGVGLTLAQLMRTHCAECGSPVEWLTDEQARERSIDLAPALLFLGITRSDEIWTCTNCDNYGVMGPTEHGNL